MNWPFVRRSRYIELENKYTTEINNLAQIAYDIKVEFSSLKLILADLRENNIKLSLNNTDLLFAKKDLKQKIRKLESENSKLKSKNGALDSHCKWLYSNFRRFKEQIEKSGYFKD